MAYIPTLKTKYKEEILPALMKEYGYIDAHFFYYDISDELTLQVEPQWTPPYNSYTPENGIGSVGVSFKLNF